MNGALLLLFILGSTVALIREELPQPDHKGYILPAVLAVSIWAGIGFHIIVSWIKNQRIFRFKRVSLLILSVAIFLILLIPLFIIQYSSNNLHDSRWADKLGNDVLNPLPDSSIVMFNDISSYFISVPSINVNINIRRLVS